MTVIHRSAIAFDMANEFEDQLAWLTGLLAEYRVTATEAARRAGLNPSTLTSFIQGRREGHELSTGTVKKLKAAFKGAKSFETDGFAEDAAEPLAIENMPQSAIKTAINAIKQGRNAVEPWLVTGKYLENLRLYDGDVMMIDFNAEPVKGDVVVAQLYDWQRASAKTVFRVFHPPYLLSGALIGDREPLRVDDRSVIIKGVMLTRLSPRSMLH
jgi:hypothetical protein